MVYRSRSQQQHPNALFAHSQDSEMLGALHLDSKVVGVDYYTNYPADLTSLPKVSDANGK